MKMDLEELTTTQTPVSGRDLYFEQPIKGNVFNYAVQLHHNRTVGLIVIIEADPSFMAGYVVFTTFQGRVNFVQYVSKARRMELTSVLEALRKGHANNEIGNYDTNHIATVLLDYTQDIWSKQICSI